MVFSLIKKLLIRLFSQKITLLMREPIWLWSVFCSFLILRMLQSYLVYYVLFLVQNLLLVCFFTFFYFWKILIFILFLRWTVYQLEFWSSFLDRKIFLYHLLKHALFNLYLKLILRFLLFFLTLSFSGSKSLEKLKLLITLLYYLLGIFNVWTFMSLIA